MNKLRQHLRAQRKLLSTLHFALEELDDTRVLRVTFFFKRDQGRSINPDQRNSPAVLLVTSKASEAFPMQWARVPASYASSADEFVGRDKAPSPRESVRRSSGPYFSQNPGTRGRSAPIHGP